MKWAIAIVTAFLITSAEAHAEEKKTSLNIFLDTQFAEQLLDIACTNKEIDEDYFRESDLLQAQIAHHGSFAERFSMENYIAGLKKVSRCEVLEKDPFRFAALVERRGELNAALQLLKRNDAEISEKVSALLLPYVPQGTQFSGGVVIAAASFSCGGFAKGDYFFIDLQCIAGDIEEEIEAVTYLSAHETYHTLQSQFVPPPMSSSDNNIKSISEARDSLFHNLVTEGSATYVADFREVEGDGRYANFSRDLAVTNYRRLKQSFLLFDYLVESLGFNEAEAMQRSQDVYELGFGGQFGELFYYVGAQMAAEIDADYGAEALACVLQLSPENLVLGYGRAFDHGERLKDSYALRTQTYDAAKSLAEMRGLPVGPVGPIGPIGLDACL